MSTPNADYRALFDAMCLSPLAPNQELLASTPGVGSGIQTAPYQANGQVHNFNENSQLFTQTYSSPVGTGEELQIYTWGGIAQLRPSNGQQYFTVGDTITMTIDLPISITANPVPEPTSFVGLSLGIASVLRSRLKARSRRSASRQE